MIYFKIYIYVNIVLCRLFSEHCLLSFFMTYFHGIQIFTLLEIQSNKTRSWQDVSFIECHSMPLTFESEDSWLLSPERLVAFTFFIESHFDLTLAILCYQVNYLLISLFQFSKHYLTFVYK